MQDTSLISAPTSQTSEKMYMENTLLRVSGALFCHDAKRARTRVQEIILDRGVPERHISIRPDPEYGQPGPLAHKIFVAIIKKHSDYGRPIQTDISFTKRELMRLIGRSKWGGSASQQLDRALNEIHHTFVRTTFKIKDNRAAEHSFNIFSEIYLERAQSEHDPIERCTVTLARPIIASLQDDHFTCLNHAVMRELGTIGQALLMRLFFHFANLYDGHHKSRLSFPKRYDDICSEWLGGLTVLANKSSIERDQLGPHLRQLIQVGFLASCGLTRARNGDGFVLTFRPGATFFADYDRFYRHRQQGELQFLFSEDRDGTAEPLKVAYLFLEKRTGKPRAGIPYVPSKDVDTARELLSQLGFDQIGAFIDYGLEEAKKTRFDVQTLGGLKQYLARFSSRSAAQVKASAANQQRDRAARATEARMAYASLRRNAADRLFLNLPPDEQAAIVALARSKMSSPNRKPGPLADTLFLLDRALITTQRHPERIPTFEQWQVSALGRERAA